LVEGLRVEFRNGMLVRLDADVEDDRDFLSSYLDGDPSGNGQKLGEVALVDSTSRIGQHLDVMIGGPDLEVTGIDGKGKRVPVIADGLWAISRRRSSR
jgi:leucyl aminopeptidase (aminopeptidase T)